MVANGFTKNLFILPSGRNGRLYVEEMVRLTRAWNERGPLMAVAGIAENLMPHLLLQRNVNKADKETKKKQNAALGRRLQMWESGKIDELLQEAQALQNRVRERPGRMSEGQLSRAVAAAVFMGNIRGAAKLVEIHGTQAKGGRLALSPDVISELRNKHPPAEELNTDAVLEGVPPTVHHAIFDDLGGDKIKRAFLSTNGSGGVSGADAQHWKRCAASFRGASSDLVQAKAEKARLMCTEYHDPSTLVAYLNNRLVALDKNPGVRPVGIGEVERRAIGKAVLHVLSQEVKDAAGVDNMCTGQFAACEAIVHAMKSAFEGEAADGLLLVDADNAFNRLNRKVALLNMRHICPSLSIILINCYRSPASLYVSGGLELSSEEGVTQGDPLAMVMYGLALLPLIRAIRPNEGEGVQSWYADDGQAVGRFAMLRKWWDELVRLGPRYGYYPRAVKTVLVVKRASQRQEADEAFDGTGVRIVGTGDPGDVGGARDLGAAIGSEAYRRSYIEEKVLRWVAEVECLSVVAKVQPHAAHALLVHGLRHRWTYIQRCMGDVQGAFDALETALRLKFIPALFGDGQHVSDRDRDIYALPAREGGIAIDNPAAGVADKHIDSKELTEAMQRAILDGGRVPEGLDEDLRQARSSIKLRRSVEVGERAQSMVEGLPVGSTLRRAMVMAREKGASCVFSVRPSEEFGFVFKSKRDFRDLLGMRYARPLRLQEHCACGAVNSVGHSQVCSLGGFIIQRHNEMAELWGVNCKKVHRDVQVRPEPMLLPLEGEQEDFTYNTANTEDEARSDVRVRGFWGNRQDAFFDFRVFYPLAPSYCSKNLKSVYRLHSREKKRMYEERITRVDNGSFTPMVMSTAGGMGPEMDIALKGLAAAIAEKEGSEYSEVVSVLRARFSFAAARCALVCLRGSRTLFNNRGFRGRVGEFDAPTDLVAAGL